MAFCQKCGSQIGDQQKFCPKCGEKQIIEYTPVSAPDQIASNNPPVEKPTQPYRKGFMTASNILSMIALAIYRVTHFVYLDYGEIGYMVFFAIIPSSLAIVSFVFGIISQHKVTLFISVFTFAIWMFFVLFNILLLI